MPNLICDVPFPRNGLIIAKGCLRTQAIELANANNPPNSRLGAQIANIRVVYYGAEANQVNQGDVLVVFAHGGKDDATLSDNAGNNILVGTLIDKLSNLDAEFAAEVHFLACFSALKGHIGPQYKTTYNGISVFGSDVEAEGGLVATTRSGRIISGIWADAKRLREVTQHG